MNQPDVTPQASPQRLALPEFVALLACLFAIVAFSTDAMLPALPELAAEFSPDQPNRAQLILTFFVAGMGVGTLFVGPISDAIGRKRTITIGFVIYALSSVATIFSQSIEMLLLTRFLQGIGASGPRIVGLAMVRDLYAGREMARIVSFVMMIFILIPAFAPLLGSGLIWLSGWHGVFVSFVVFAIIGALWLNLRQPETLPPERRRPLRLTPLRDAASEVLSSRHVLICTAILTLSFGQMFSLLSSSQQLFVDTYGKVDSFPLWFAAVALLSGTSSILNAKFVTRYGMRRIAKWAYMMQVGVSTTMLILVGLNLLPASLAFPAFFIWMVSVFFMAGVTFGNLNALALQPMGHIAGMAASIVAAISTIASTLIAGPVGLLYDGTALPAIIATLTCSGLACILIRFLHD